jgi:ABC-type Fe3+-hydroxamate transport system substrate-binding protein
MLMHLSTPSTASPPRHRTVPLAWFVVGVIIAAGVSVAGVAALYEYRSSPPAGPLTVTDDEGRQVNVPNDPARVVVFGPSVMDSMFRLGLRAHIVGVDCYAASLGGLSDDYSSDQIALWNLTSSMCVEVEPSFSSEALLAIGPQLILSASLGLIPTLEQFSTTAHVPVVFLQPATLSGIVLDDQILAEIFGVGAKATVLENTVGAELARAAAFQANLSTNFTPFPTVLVTYSTDSSGYWTFGPGTFGESLIELASGTSIGANSTTSFPELSGEQVLASNPEFIVYGTGFGLNESSYTSAPFWNQLSATQDGKVVGLDSNYFTEPDPTMILVGLPELIAVLHPGTV